MGGVHENDANVRGQVVADAGAMQARRSWDTDMVTPAVHALCSGDGARREGCAARSYDGTLSYGARTSQAWSAPSPRCSARRPTARGAIGAFTRP